MDKTIVFWFLLLGVILLAYREARGTVQPPSPGAAAQQAPARCRRPAWLCVSLALFLLLTLGPWAVLVWLLWEVW